MRLSKLLQNIPDLEKHGLKDPEIKGISSDSRNVKKGYIFVAHKGLHNDGHNFIAKSIENGAIAIVGSESFKRLNIPENVIYIKAKNTALVIGLLASNFFGNPDAKLKIVGVTGTDGKTTTSSLIYAMVIASGKKAGLVSTVNANIAGKKMDTGFHVTSPDAVSLQSFLKQMVDKGCEYAVLEVTSHGLDQERFAGTHFDIGVLTNITHEHLDYHKTYLNYLNTKSKLFKEVGVAIINKRDMSYKPIKKRIPKKEKIISYDFNDLPNAIGQIISAKFPEEYNRMNATAAYYAVRELGISQKDILKGIKTFEGIEGRMESVENIKGIEVIVDFAHTPNALESVLTALRKKLDANKRLIVVFGCASERDNAKRPMMAGISTTVADSSVFTAEDPRSEDIQDIFAEMEKGVGKKHNDYFKIPERGEAISFAINKLAKKGDIVVICGKGHEKSMAYNGVEYPWSDKEAVKLALKGKALKIEK